MKALERFLEWGGARKDIALLAISAVALLISIFDLLPLPFDAAWVAIVLCGVPIILEAVIGLVTAFDIKADVLVSIALIASVVIGEDFAAGEVAFIMQLGGLLEELTVARARAGIERLVHLTPRTARVVRDGEERTVPAEEVGVGELLRVLPGETVPVDGVITLRPDLRRSGGDDRRIPARGQGRGRRGDERHGQPVRRLRDAAPRAWARTAPSSAWCAWCSPPTRARRRSSASPTAGPRGSWSSRLTAAALTWLISGEIIRAVTILVVFCPCALVLATPTAIMAAIGNATHHGFLVREGDALERLAGVSRVAFDKTGTLTYGAPQVAAVVSALPEHVRRGALRPRRRRGAALGAPAGQGRRPRPARGNGQGAARAGGLFHAAGPRRARDGGGQARGRGQRAAAGGGGRRAPRAGGGERPRTQRQGMQPHLPRRGRRLRGLHRPFRHAAPRRARHRAARARSAARSRCCSPAITKTPPQPSPPASASANTAPAVCRRTSSPISTRASSPAGRSA